MRYLLALLLLVPGLSHARYNQIINPLVTGATVAGVVVGTQYAFYRSLMASELEGWKNKDTDSTVSLESQCNMNAEFHLVGDHSKNFVLVGISNLSDKTVSVKPSDIEFVFNGENTRFPGWFIQPSDMELKPGWWQLGYIPFPSKEEFAKYENLQVKVTVNSGDKGACVITGTFKKSKKILREEMSYTVMDINFEGGPSLLQTGPVKYLGKPSGMFALGMNVYGHPNHGFGFTLLGESSFEDSKNLKIQNEFKKGSQYRANTTFLGINYAYRHFISHRVTFNYEPALGYQTIFDSRASSSSDNGRQEKASAFAFAHKAMINWTFARLPMPTYRNLDFVLGAGLVHIWVPSEKINGQNLNGDRYGALVRFGMGF
jgi:hypothetical protein